MQERCSQGSVGERGGNEPRYPEKFIASFTCYVEASKVKIRCHAVRPVGGSAPHMIFTPDR